MGNLSPLTRLRDSRTPLLAGQGAFLPILFTDRHGRSNCPVRRDRERAAEQPEENSGRATDWELLPLSPPQERKRIEYLWSVRRPHVVTSVRRDRAQEGMALRGVSSLLTLSGTPPWPGPPCAPGIRPRRSRLYPLWRPVAGHCRRAPVTRAGSGPRLGIRRAGRMVNTRAAGACQLYST